MKKKIIIAVVIVVAFAAVICAWVMGVFNKKTDVKTEEKAQGIDYMALVNKTHALPDDWENQLETVHITNSVGDDVEVEKKAYDAYLKLKDDLEKNES